MIGRILGRAWSIAFTSSLLLGLFDGEQMTKNWDTVSQISMFIVVQNIFAVFVVMATFLGLSHTFPVLKWSWLSLFKYSDPQTNKEVRYEGTNIHFTPSRVKYFGLVFLLVLAVHMPQFAHIEEEMFREGTISWYDGILKSLLFGMLHCIVGVPLSAGLAISLGGIWFTHQYFVDGVALSTIHHTTYNLIIVTIMFIGLLLKHIHGFLSVREEVV